FSVLDFGLAVRSQKWHLEWQGRNIAGDPRYFSPSAWMQLTYGYKYLEAHPEEKLLRLYSHRLDHYAFGVMAAEVFFALWKGPEEFKDEKSEEGAKWRQAIEAARKAWRAYWTQSVALFQKFHAIGAVAIRQYL
ncbi:unnamed protein product, partial [Polarella glacialis]